MERLSKDINKIEKSVARYIYIKYIQEKGTAPALENGAARTDASSDAGSDAGSDASSDAGSDSNSDADDDEDTVEIELSKPKPKPKTKKARPKILDKAAYTAYQKNIFHQSRSCFTLNQDDLIREDIRIMTLADEAYEEHPSEFKVGDFELPPDVLRCSFIRKHHHRYYRCRNQIMNKDSDVCKKHENSENIYYDNYNDLLEKLIT